MADGSAKIKEAQREVAGLKAELRDCCPEVKKGTASLEQELAKRLKPELLAPAEAYVAASLAPKVIERPTAPECSLTEAETCAGDSLAAVCTQQGDQIPMENAVDCLRFLSATKCNMPTE
jgi:hypothetical protein